MIYFGNINGASVLGDEYIVFGNIPSEANPNDYVNFGNVSAGGAGGGGAGVGFTIIDENDVELPKRSNLQFFNAIATDDEENDTTIITLMGAGFVPVQTYSPNIPSLELGGQAKVSISETPSNATNPTYQFSSDDDSIFTVDGDGNITGVGLGVANLIITVVGNYLAPQTYSVQVRIFYSSAGGFVETSLEEVSIYNQGGISAQYVVGGGFYNGTYYRMAQGQNVVLESNDLLAWSTKIAYGFGGDVKSFRVNEDTGEMLLGTSTGVYKSIDLGNNWTLVLGGNTGMIRWVDGDVWLVAHDATGTLKRSIDGGLTWVDVVTGFATGCLDVSPTNRDLVIIVANNVYKRSTNGGLTFENMTGLSGVGNSVAFGIEGRVYCSVGNNFMYSDDDGITWNAGFTGLGIIIGMFPSKFNKDYVYGRTSDRNISWIKIDATWNTILSSVAQNLVRDASLIIL